MDIGSSGTKVVLALLGLAICGSWTGSRIRSQIESKIKEQLPTMIGPADKYDVRVNAGIGQILTGRISRISVHADSVYMKKKLEAESLDVNLYGVRFSLWSQRFKGAASAEAIANIRSDQLQRYLSRKYSDISDIQCTLKPGKFYLHAKPSLIGFDMAVDSEGTLRISGKDSISVDLSKVTVAGVKAPALITNFITDRFNPVFEMSEVGLKARITDLDIMDDKASIKADLDVSSGLGIE